MTSSPIILALDTKDISEADNWVSATKTSISVYKVGLELFLRAGLEWTKELAKRHQVEIFLDLKLHDIPNTVEQAVASVSPIAPKFLTIHASGGKEMIKSAVRSAGTTSITAVTILTSLNEADLIELGFESNTQTAAVNLARLAVGSGATSIVCSPLEVSAIRKAVPENISLITPGVRPIDSEMGDQKRATTPEEALKLGANFVVIGRPITSFAKESLQAMETRAAMILKNLV